MVAGVIGVLAFIWLMPTLQVNFISVLLILVFAAFFTTVSSRITGQIGSSSNPISGMTIATLLFTSLIFVSMGRSGAGERVVALTVGAIVCVAAANAGGTSQDLKTGFLVGATPKLQQIGLMVGVLTSATLVGFTLLFLNNSYQNILPMNFASFHAPAGEIKGNWTGTPTEDGKTYRTWSPTVAVDAGDGKTSIEAGKYLVDDQGTIHYKINPGIGGTRQRLTTQSLPSQTFDLSSVKNLGQARGLDDQIYNLIAVQNGDTTQQLLVDNTGKAHYVIKEDATKLDAPKAALMGILVDGVLTRKLPWTMVLIGVFISIVLEVVGVQALPVAVGMYLPISTSATIFVGGLIRAVVEWMAKKKGSAEDVSAETGRGVLLSSGLIAGGAIGGLCAAIGRAIIDHSFPGKGEEKLGFLGTDHNPLFNSDLLPFIFFLMLVFFLFKVARTRLATE